MNDKNKFNEELEKEIQSGLHNTLDETAPGQDFTVKVHRQEYVVKRRFYDKDKALETAEDLRRDKQNVVEDNLEGQALSSDLDDEKVDWDKLIDAGLQFDPPIPQAADLKPGDAPVGLAEPLARPDSDGDDDLEKTFLVRQKPKAPVEEAEDKETGVLAGPESPEAHEAEPSAVEETDGSTDSENGDNEESQEPLRRSRYAPPPRSQAAHKADSGKTKRLAAAALVAVVILSGLFFMVKGPDKAGEETPSPSVTTHPVPQPIPATPPSADGSAAPAVKETDIPAAPPVNPPPAPPVKGAPVDVEPLPFTVHVNSCKVITEVDTTISRLTGMGQVAFTGLVSISGKGNWYRTYAGYFKTQEEASALAEGIRKALGEDANAVKAPWSIQIGDAVSSVEADKQVALLRGKGYRAYVLPSAGSDTVRVLAGAFAREKEAVPMADALKKEGFKTTVALR